MNLKTISFIILSLVAFLSTSAQPGTAEEPVKFVGDLDVDFSRPDGELPPVVGAQSFQVLRSVKNDKNLGDGLGFTFHHHPMLSYWKDKFYVLCNACPEHEERELTEILLSTSENGMNWDQPKIVFPHVIYKGEPTFCNHRMGFYVAPSGRLLASTAYFPQSEMPPQTGSEDTGKKYFGVAIREVKENGKFGEIYFIARNNSLYDEDDFPFPYYTESKDKGFIEDCESLRNDKLLTLHWWEQIRPENFDFPPTLEVQIDDGNRKFAKAISYFHREDGAVVALWKNSKSAISYDNGETWSRVVDLETFSDGYAKVWGQRTEDGRYAASWRPLGRGSWGRYPMLWATSDDGILFDGAMHVNGEVTRRYEGGSKNIGPCNYQRGLYENGPDIPGDDVWVVYSMSKEDIWISRIPVPFMDESPSHIDQDFEAAATVKDLREWNIFHPQWAPVSVEKAPARGSKALKFADKDPFDYAKAFRVFETSRSQLDLEFSLLAGQNDHGRFEIDLGNTERLAPLRISLTSEGTIEVEHWKKTSVIGNYEPGEWMDFKLKINVSDNTFTVTVDGNESEELIFNSRRVRSLDRVTFRTGMARGIAINPVDPAEDLPLDQEATFYLDNLQMKQY
ncbi:MAG: hypothetical protein K9G38_07540 [Bacteroidales bacterium]|nr:hypothetical protein [Bacteroidales bacterium]